VDPVQFLNITLLSRFRDGNKKDAKTKKSKKKKDTNTSAFTCMQEDDPGSIKLAKQVDVEQRLEFIKSFKK
jgi:hypothetical protein